MRLEAVRASGQVGVALDPVEGVDVYDARRHKVHPVVAQAAREADLLVEIDAEHDAPVVDVGPVEAVAW